MTNEREYSGLGDWGKRRGVSRTNPFAGRRINVVADTPKSRTAVPDYRGLLERLAVMPKNSSGLPSEIIAAYDALANEAERLLAEPFLNEGSRPPEVSDE